MPHRSESGRVRSHPDVAPEDYFLDARFGTQVW